MTLREMYEEAVGRLDECGVPDANVDAFYLLEHITGLSKMDYLLNKDRSVTPDVQKAYEEIIEKRAARMPYQYLTGEADFLGYTIKVNENVLIPRLDTEILVEEALKKLEGRRNAKVLDMCTGSGCIAIALKCMKEDAEVTAVDISAEALDLAKENAKINEAEIEIFLSDLFEAVKGRKFDIIVSNPPYVTESEYETLMPEVKEHEPKLALTAGEDGLDIYRRLAEDAPELLNEGGWMLMEIGCAQSEAVEALLETQGFKEIFTVKDLAGLDRVVGGRH